MNNYFKNNNEKAHCKYFIRRNYDNNKKSMQIFFPLSYSYFETFLAALYFGSSIFCSSYYDQEADLCLYEITSNHSYLKS